MNDAFSARLIVWQQQQGRHDLPWQASRDPYSVWLSEIMLQQTQVSTVIPYFERFMAHFPDVRTLAAAPQDEVLGFWSGLGYYSRARHLHAAAQQIVSCHGGEFPQNPAALEQLPGIGRSTAAAIAAFCFNARAAILDGNVKRVLARHFGISGYAGASLTQKRLWTLAESLLPQAGVAAYTQALMDLGATRCTRRKPACPACPVADTCFARCQGQVDQLPTPKPRSAVPQQELWLVAFHYQDKVWLTQRAQQGIWGGLWCLPEYATAPDAAQLCLQQWGVAAGDVRMGAVLRHNLTHRRMAIVPVWVALAAAPKLSCGGWWANPEEALKAGIPVPVRKILQAEFKP